MARLPVVVATTLVTLLVCQQANGGTISWCSSRRTELTSASLYCGGLTADNELLWRFIQTSGKSVTLATCNNTSCTGLHPSFTRGYRYQYSYGYGESYIYFNATRDMAGTAICSEVFSNGTIVSSNCTQDIVYPFQVNDVRVTTNFENWTLTAEFNTSKVFSALGVYDVEVGEYSQWVNGGNYLTGPAFVVSEKSFEVFTDVTTGMDYNRGTFSVTWPIPNTGGKYYYTARFIPDGQTSRIHPKDNGYMTISKPSQPETNCEFTYIPEVGPINCQCSSMSLGTPAGRLRWLVGNEIVFSGGYDIKQLQFPANRVNRSHDGKKVTCQVDWVEKQQVFVTGNVAYGPGSVSIQVQSDNCLVIAICTVDQVNPFRPDMMQWGGLCQGHRGDVCTIKFRGAEDDGKEITCTVTNHVNNRHSVTASANVTASDCGTGRDGMANSVGASVGVTVGVTVGVMLFVVCLVLVIMWTRRRYCTGETEEKSTNREKAVEKNPEHTYSDLFEITGRDITPRYVEHTSTFPVSESNEYQNMSRPRR